MKNKKERIGNKLSEVLELYKQGKKEDILKILDKEIKNDDDYILSTEQKVSIKIMKYTLSEIKYFIENAYKTNLFKKETKKLYKIGKVFDSIQNNIYTEKALHENFEVDKYIYEKTIRMIKLSITAMELLESGDNYPSRLLLRSILENSLFIFAQKDEETFNHIIDKEEYNKVKSILEHLKFLNLSESINLVEVNKDNSILLENMMNIGNNITIGDIYENEEKILLKKGGFRKGEKNINITEFMQKSYKDAMPNTPSIAMGIKMIYGSLSEDVHGYNSLLEKDSSLHYVLTNVFMANIITIINFINNNAIDEEKDEMMDNIDKISGVVIYINNFMKSEFEKEFNS